MVAGPRAESSAANGLGAPIVEASWKGRLAPPLAKVASKMKKGELMDELARLGQPVDGLKSELVQRLVKLERELAEAGERAAALVEAPCTPTGGERARKKRRRIGGGELRTVSSPPGYKRRAEAMLWAASGEERRQGWVNLALGGARNRSCVVPLGVKILEGFTPPRSPFHLIQEDLSSDPWRVLVACVLLNRTDGPKVRGAIGELFSAFPTAEAMAEASADPGGVLCGILQPLGMHLRRARNLVAMSRSYLDVPGGWDGDDPKQLPGCGKYAADAFAIFCQGQWRDVHVQDHMLSKYHAWLKLNVCDYGPGDRAERE